MVNVLGAEGKFIVGSLLRVHQDGTLDFSGEIKTAVCIFIHFHKSVYR